MAKSKKQKSVFTVYQLPSSDSGLLPKVGTPSAPRGRPKKTEKPKVPVQPLLASPGGKLFDEEFPPLASPKSAVNSTYNGKRNQRASETLDFSRARRFSNGYRKGCLPVQDGLQLKVITDKEEKLPLDEKTGTQPMHYIELPCWDNWFNFGSVSSLEIKTFSDFLKGDEDDLEEALGKYKKIRDFLITTYVHS